MNLGTLRDDAVDISDRFATAHAAIADALSAGTATAAQLGAVDAALAGIQADVTSLRAELDAVDVTAYQVYPDAEVTLRLWTWERGLRHQLGLLRAGMVSARAAAQQLIAGQRRDMYVVRSGDTLQAIAARFLGDWREWTRIADANELEPGQPAAGTVLILPPKR